ncbi:MAG: iron-sulfur cluster assembly scaffold protein [Candidatus Sulfotelmatobacter sp.]
MAALRDWGVRREKQQTHRPTTSLGAGRRYAEPFLATMEPMYSAQLLDHFQNPRNAGDLAAADAVAEISNPVCGDVVRVSLQVCDERITEIRFKAKGCVPAMACGSALTELARGKTVAEARKLKRDDLIAAVGGLPPASSHAAQLALDALSAALNQITAARKP